MPRPHITPFALLASLLLASACGPQGIVPELLESFSTELRDGDWSAVESSGTLKVSGSEQDFLLRLTAPSAEVEVQVHSPGHSDLLTLDGKSVDLDLSEAGLNGERNLLIQDEDGPLFLVEVGWGGSAAAELFGEDFARFGETLATDSDEQYDWEYTMVDFKTDEGQVSLKPGMAQDVKLDGATWRLVVIAAYKVDPHENAALPCGGISDMMSYEMLRVEQASEPVFLRRPASADFAFLGCL